MHWETRWYWLLAISNRCTIQQIKADNGILVSSDVPEMLQPEVQINESRGPFATKTLLGWGAKWPLGREDVKVGTMSAIQTNSAPDQRFKQFCNMEFNDLNYDPQPSMSQNDKRALHLMEESVKLVNGHYEITLPSKNYPPYLSNVSQGRQSLRSLKKGLEQDPSLLEKYKRVMDNVAKRLCKKIYYSRCRPPENPLVPSSSCGVSPTKTWQDSSRVWLLGKILRHFIEQPAVTGADLMNTLICMLSFREELVAMMANIEAMFYQVPRGFFGGLRGSLQGAWRIGNANTSLRRCIFPELCQLCTRELPKTTWQISTVR